MIMQSTTSQQAPQTVVADDLAREKVHEIEESLKNGSATNPKAFATWFSILKQIITAADLHRTNDNKDNRSQVDGQTGKNDTGDSIYADYGDDNEQFTTQVDMFEQFATNSVKWTIRVQAFKIVHKLVQFVNVATDDVKPPSQVLVRHLPDLVRLSFVAATSPYDELKMQGLEMFRVLVERFATYEEIEFPGHSILEQYKTQILSAVKPAFNLDAPPYITAIACQICSLWICQGLEKDLVDIKRTYQLMLLSIVKLEGQSVNQHSKLYTESELEQERVDILGAWAQLYISSKEAELSELQHGKISKLSRPECTNLNELVRSHIGTLVDKWWEGMKDYALLIMPSPKLIGTSHDNENVYTREVALRLFSPTWPKLVLALTIWLCNEYDHGDRKIKYCKFLCGIIMKELCRCLMNKSNSRCALPQSTILTLRAINFLLSNDVTQSVFIDNLSIAQEFYCILYQLAVSHARDPNRLLLRQTLDQLFELVVGKIEEDGKNIHYGLAKLITSLMSTMKDMEIASNEKSTIDLDSSRIHLSIRLRNLLTLLKSAPKFSMKEVPLQVAFISVFQELLRFDQEPTVSVTSADQLKDFLVSIEDRSMKEHIIDELFPELCIRVDTLLSSLFSSNKYSEIDKLHLSQADSFLKSMRLMISSLSQESRRDKAESYVATTLKPLKSCDSSSEVWISAEGKKKRELVEFVLNQSSALRTMYTNDELSPEVQRKLDDAIALQQDIKNKLESQNQKQRITVKSSSSRPQVAKIALKADFSNFYDKKV